MSHAALTAALTLAIDPDRANEPEAEALARDVIELVRDRGAGDIGDLTAKLRQVARHFPRVQ